ncbi:MAG TPA: hypothetical protein VHI78_00225 [Bacteroidales bacterium]|jgi:hypothetical protein|nr:hypothetical protein [Bacteroidales bacterium]
MKQFSFSTTRFLVVYLLILLYAFASCTHDPESIEELDDVCFDTQVFPLLKTSCGISGCHNGGEEHFNLTDYNSVMELVTPGDPRSSKLYKIITDIRSDDMMPPENPLTRTQRNIIQVWIAQGAKETLCSQDTGGIPVDRICFVQDILPMIASSCGITGCHDQVTAEEDYVFIDYNGIMEGIQPFSPDGSEIYEAVTENGEDIMPPPPRAPLTSGQIADLREWIEDGAANSDCPQNTCDTAGLISFSAQIDPLLKNTCTGCHNATLANGNVNLSGYNNVATQANNLRSGIPVMIGSIKRMNGFVAMPPAYNIDECKISTIEKWIGQGAQNN